MFKIISVLTGVGLIFTAPAEAAREPELVCYEDEVIVWTGDAHDACVALDHMWQDPVTGTIHWRTKDERR